MTRNLYEFHVRIHMCDTTQRIHDAYKCWNLTYNFLKLHIRRKPLLVTFELELKTDIFE